MKEQWKPIADFSGYEVSDRGRVRSYWKREGRRFILSDRPQRILKGGYTCRNKNYLAYCLKFLHGCYVSRYAHQLVLEAFVGPRPDGMECCHNNGNHKDNRLMNLRYDTHEANVQDSVKHSTWNLHYLGKFTKEQAAEIRKQAQRGIRYSKLAKRWDASESTIRSLCIGDSYTDAPGPLMPSAWKDHAALTRAQADALRAERKKGKTFAQLMEQFNISRNTVRHVLRRIGSYA